MSLQDILKYNIVIPAPQFHLIAHFVKWFLVPEDIEMSLAYMILDGKKYQDGLFMSYMMQIHDMIMLRSVHALVAATVTVAGEDFIIFVEVYENLAKLSFRKDD